MNTPDRARTGFFHAINRHRGIVRGVGGAAMIGGGAAWGVTFIRFAVEHPGLDNSLFLWPFLSVAILGCGMLLAKLARWGPVSSGLPGTGAALVAATVPCVIPFLHILGLVSLFLFLPGSVIFGVGLIRSGRTRLPGWLILLATGAFLITRPWMLGEVQYGSALEAQEVVEVALAIALGASWAVLGISCLRGDDDVKTRPPVVRGSGRPDEHQRDRPGARRPAADTGGSELMNTQRPDWPPPGGADIRALFARRIADPRYISPLVIGK